MLCHTNLVMYYRTMFALMLTQHMTFSVTDIESIMPYERDLYIDMLSDHIKKLEEANRT